MVRIIKGNSSKNPSQEVLCISFEYSSDYVSKIRQVEGRFWNANLKRWEVPLGKISQLIDLFNDDIIMAKDVDINYVIKKGDFAQELSYIQTPELKEFAEMVLKDVPSYFFEVAASSTGKYHPAYALGEGGLLRHTKAAIHIALELLSNSTIYPSEDIGEVGRDCVILALLFHDCLKHGSPKEQYTVEDHPNLAADFIINLGFGSSLIPGDYIYQIAGLIRSHMGQWNTNKSGEVILPKPVSVLEKLVHEADYLASRKIIEIKFDENWNVIK